MSRRRRSKPKFGDWYDLWDYKRKPRKTPAARWLAETYVTDPKLKRALVGTTQKKRVRTKAGNRPVMTKADQLYLDFKAPPDPCKKLRERRRRAYFGFLNRAPSVRAKSGRGASLIKRVRDRFTVKC